MLYIKRHIYKLGNTYNTHMHMYTRSILAVQKMKDVWRKHEEYSCIRK